MKPITPEEIALVLDEAVEVMNDEGAHWHQGSMRSTEPMSDGKYAYCSIGAIEIVVHRREKHFARRDHLRQSAVEALRAAYGAVNPGRVSIAEWNDSEKTTWKNVKDRFRRARNKVLREAKEGGTP